LFIVNPDKAYSDIFPVVVVKVPAVANEPLLLAKLILPDPVDRFVEGNVSVPVVVIESGPLALKAGTASVTLPVLKSTAPPEPADSVRVSLLILVEMALLLAPLTPDILLLPVLGTNKETFELDALPIVPAV
jgi:hypothetical protein